MKELSYIEVGEVFGVHPLHVRRIVKKYPRLIQPIIHGYNRISFRMDQVKRVKVQRQRDAVKSRQSAAKKRTGARREE